MTVDDETTPELRCRTCGARNAAGAVWCSLCFLSLVEESGPAEASDDDDRPDLRDRREEGEDLADGEPHVDAMLAELAVREAPASRLSGVSSALSGPGARVAVMLGGTVLVTGGAFGLMAAAGSLL